MNFFASHVHIYAICVECQNPAQISQSITARLSVCGLGVKNSGRVHALLVSHKHPAPIQLLGISHAKMLLSSQNALIHDGI